MSLTRLSVWSYGTFSRIKQRLWLVNCFFRRTRMMPFPRPAIAAPVRHRFSLPYRREEGGETCPPWVGGGDPVGPPMSPSLRLTRDGAPGGRGEQSRERL